MCMKNGLPKRRSGNVPVTLEQAEFEYALVLRRVQFSVTEAFTRVRLHKLPYLLSKWIDSEHAMTMV